MKFFLEYDLINLLSNLFFCFSKYLRAFTKFFKFVPDIIVTQFSSDSGLSCASLKLIALNFKIDDSSLIVPLSEITNFASF